MPSRPDIDHVSIRALRKRYGPRAVLDGIDLDVEAGSLLLLTGRNGSGKTTLLRCVAGLAAYEGTIAVGGEHPRVSARARQGLGYLPQTLGLPEWATVDEVLALFARLRRADVGDLDLPDDFLPPRDQIVDSLSGGQRQRVALAVAMLGAPGLLLLDEPTANLDDEGRLALCGILERSVARGTTVVVAAPSALDLEGLPDRTVRLRDGQVVDGGGRTRAAAPDLAPATRLQEIAS